MEIVRSVKLIEVGFMTISSVYIAFRPEEMSGVDVRGEMS